MYLQFRSKRNIVKGISVISGFPHRDEVNPPVEINLRELCAVDQYQAVLMVLAMGGFFCLYKSQLKIDWEMGRERESHTYLMTLFV